MENKQWAPIDGSTGIDKLIDPQYGGGVNGDSVYWKCLEYDSAYFTHNLKH